MELSECRGGEKTVAMEHGFDRDPLMKNPIRESEPDTVCLDPASKPIPAFRLRKEKFGYLVTRYNWSIPVSEDAKIILNAIDGGNTICEIHERFGDVALELIGLLYQQGCVAFD